MAKSKDFKQPIEELLKESSNVRGISKTVLEKRPFREYSQRDKEQFARYFAELIKNVVMAKAYKPGSAQRNSSIARAEEIIEKLNYYEYLGKDRDVDKWFFCEDPRIEELSGKLWSSI